MSECNYASLESQLFNEVCEAEDTEDMFVLRCSEDYDSLISLGNALAGQYRFKEAVEAYEQARMIKSEDLMLYLRLAGANLSLFRFDEAKQYYDIALDKGISRETVYFYYGMWNYLKGDYKCAAECLTKCYPCDDEMKISIIFWQTLASVKAGLSPELLKDAENLKINHHTAYKKIVSLFSNDYRVDDITISEKPLDSAIENYGMYVFTNNNSYLDKCLENISVWPCVAYLAAWRENNDTMGRSLL